VDGRIAIGIPGAWQNTMSMLADRKKQWKTLTEEAFSIVVHFLKMVSAKSIV